MMKPRFTPLFAALLAPAFILLWVPLLSAQAESNRIDRLEIFGGYSLAASEFGIYGGVTNGWNASLNTKVMPNVGLVADFAGYYKTIGYGANVPSDHSTTYTFTFGPQISKTFSRLTPFGHALIGFGQIDSTQDARPSYNPIKTANSLALVIGGGLDVRLSGRIAWRVEGDYLHTSFQPADNQLTATGSNVRFCTGLVFRF
jgi:opacity protein-like surface antigen